MILDQTPFQTAAEILNNLSYVKTSELSEKISLAAGIFAEASGYSILPCPKWETKAKAYKPAEARSYIAMFGGSVAGDIQSFEMYKDGPGHWLKSLHKEWVADQAREWMLNSFDHAYERWLERKNMSREEIRISRLEAVERYNRTFREAPYIGRGVFFANELDRICS